jgi:hypothetical protein
MTSSGGRLSSAVNMSELNAEKWETSASLALPRNKVKPGPGSVKFVDWGKGVHTGDWFGRSELCADEECRVQCFPQPLKHT